MPYPPHFDVVAAEKTIREGIKRANRVIRDEVTGHPVAEAVAASLFDLDEARVHVLLWDLRRKMMAVDDGHAAAAFGSFVANAIFNFSTQSDDFEGYVTTFFAALEHGFSEMSKSRIDHPDLTLEINEEQVGEA